MKRLAATITLSVVLPVFSEESNQQEIHSRLSTTLDELGLFRAKRETNCSLRDMLLLA